MVTLVSLERLFASRSARLPTIDANPGAAPLESGGGALAQAS